MVTYQWGGSLNTTRGKLSLDDTENFAGVLNMTLRPGAKGELYYSYQPTTLRLESVAGVPQTVAPMNVHYFQVGGRYEPPGARTSRAVHRGPRSRDGWTFSRWGHYGWGMGP
jgi:hypothetical protein